MAASDTEGSIALSLLVHDGSGLDEMGPDLTTGVATWSPAGPSLERSAPWAAFPAFDSVPANPDGRPAVGGWLGMHLEAHVHPSPNPDPGT